MIQKAVHSSTVAVGMFRSVVRIRLRTSGRDSLIMAQLCRIVVTSVGRSEGVSHRDWCSV